MEAIVRSVVQQMDLEKKERLSGTPVPVEITKELGNTAPQQLQDNFRKFRRDTQKHNLDEWTTPEKINKSSFLISKNTQQKQPTSLTPSIKLQKIQVSQARVAMEIFEQLQFTL